MKTARNRITAFIVAALAAAALAACGSAVQDGDQARAVQSTQEESAGATVQSSVDDAVSSQKQTEPSGDSTFDFAQKVQLGLEVEFDGIASWLN